MYRIKNILGGAIYKLRNKDIYKITKNLNEQQWLKKETLSSLCKEKLKKLLKYSYREVPYYKKILQENKINVNNLTLCDDLKKIPVLTKETLRTQGESLKGKSKYVNSAIHNASGGSTGIPVKFITDVTQYRYTEGFLNHVFSWSGWKIGENVLCIWGTEKQKLPISIKNSIKFFIKRQIIVSALTYNEEIFTHWYKIIKKYRPGIIYCYPSVAALFSKWLNTKNIRVEGIKGVYCSAENLLESQRKIIEKIFCCKVYNQYGSRETPGVSCECPNGNIHILNNINYVEFQKIENNTNDRMNIIVTSLVNYAQPLIRYDTGDFGRRVSAQCDCGRGYPLMESVLGRQNDFLITNEGQKIYASYFHHLLDNHEWIRSFQFRQKKIDEILLSIETDYVDNHKEKIKILKLDLQKKISDVFGQNITIQVRNVKSIEKTMAGKHRFVINEIKNK